MRQQNSTSIVQFEASGEVKQAFMTACFDEGFTLQMDIQESVDQWLGPEIIGVIGNVKSITEYLAALIVVVDRFAKEPKRQGYLKIERRDGTKIEVSGLSTTEITKLVDDALREEEP